MAKKINGNRKNGFNAYEKKVRKKLAALLPVFASASIGDFSKDVKLPQKIDEFTELYVGVQIMLDVVREKIGMMEEVNRSLEEKVKKLHANINEEIFIGTQGRLVKINTREILFVKSVGDYVIIHTADDRHMVHSTLKGMMNKLPAREFMRVHNSYIVRLDKIAHKKQKSLVVGDSAIPVSRSNHKELVKRLRAIKSEF